MSTEHEFDFLCIGSGPAGQRAAVQAAKLRKRVAIVERQLEVGGACLHTGTIPSKIFREAVLSFRQAQSENFDHHLDDGNGHANGERATADKLLARVDAIIRSETRIQRDQLHRNGVDIIPGSAKFTGPNAVQIHSSSGTREVTAEHMLIAVGTRPHQRGDISTDLDCVISSDDVLGLTELPRSIIVIGCGVIGIEYASMFAALGIKVTVIDGRDRPLEFLDREIVDELIHQLRDRLVTFRLGEAVASIEQRDGPPLQALVRLESGKRLVADMVLACTGRIGASDALELEPRRAEHRRPRPHRGGRRFPLRGAAYLRRRRHHRLSQPGCHVVGTGPARRLPRLWHHRRAHAGAFSGGDLCDS